MKLLTSKAAFSTRSNANRAAKARGIPLDQVIEMDGGRWGWDAHVQEVEAPAPAAPAAPAPDELPASLRISAEARKAAWDANPPKPAPRPAPISTKPAKAAKAPKANDGGKTVVLLDLLKKGATVDQMTTAMGWLPHTLRARICVLAKPAPKGMGLKIERERVDGVTSYRMI